MTVSSISSCVMLISEKKWEEKNYLKNKQEKKNYFTTDYHHNVMIPVNSDFDAVAVDTVDDYDVDV